MGRDRQSFAEGPRGCGDPHANPAGARAGDRACALCGDAPSLASLADAKAWATAHGLIVDDGMAFGAPRPLPCVPLPAAAETTVCDLAVARDTGTAAVVDVRDVAQFSICNLKGATNVPLRDIIEDPDAAAAAVRAAVGVGRTPFVLCRRGVDSRVATTELRRLGFETACDVRGGLDAWRRDIDPSFPVY